MNEIGVFDILGPNMIGPSSSHTAGALRIAFIAGKMVSKPVSVKYVLYGSFARTYRGHGTDRALVAGILGYQTDDERIRDSFEHAHAAGVSFEFNTCSIVFSLGFLIVDSGFIMIYMKIQQ